MNESIVDYIQKTFTVEMQEILMKGFALFDRLNVQTYEAFILNLLNNAEEEDPNFIASSVTSYVEGFLISLEKAFGFGLQEVSMVTLEQRIDFIRGYVDLEDYIDHEAVIRICETDMTESEKLAEAIALTTDYGVDTLLSFIDSVDESALMTLSRLHQSETPGQEKADEAELPEASETQVTQVKAYELFIKSHNLVVDCLQLVRSGFPIGAPFSLYWSQYRDTFLQLDRAKMSVEIIALFLLSKEHWSNPVLAFNNLSEELYDSVNVIAECNMEVRQLYNGFTKFKAENKIK